MNSFSNGVTTHEYVSMQSLRKVELMNLQLVEFISFSPLGLCLFDFSISVVCLPRSSFFFYSISISLSSMFGLLVLFLFMFPFYDLFISSVYVCLFSFLSLCRTLSGLPACYALSLSVYLFCLFCSLFVYFCLSVLILLSLCLSLSICSVCSALALSILVCSACSSLS